MPETVPSTTAQEILRVEDLKVHFPVKQAGLLNRSTATVKAVDGVSFTLQRGETLGLVGESGCGKSTTGLAILRMLTPTAGRIVFEGEDISAYEPARLRPIRRRMQMVYQDPFGSLNPRMKVGDIVGEPLEVHGMAGDKAQYRARIAELLSLVGLLPDMAERYPHEFSVKVPNYACFNRTVRGDRWCGFRWPDHVNYFTPRTLREMVESAGLRIARMNFFDRHPFSDNMYAVLEKPAARR